MVDRFFKFSIGFAVLTVTLGIIAAPLVGSNRSFEFGPIYSTAQRVIKWLSKSAQDSTQAETDPKPFTEEAQAAGKRVQRATQDAIANTPAFSEDPRLSICPRGSIAANTQELPATVADSFQASTKQGAKFRDLIEVQGQLGEPACNFKDGKVRQYRYITTLGRIIDARQEEDLAQVEIKFTNF